MKMQNELDKLINTLTIIRSNMEKDKDYDENSLLVLRSQLTILNYLKETTNETTEKDTKCCGNC
jgi:hypothetical protein